MAPSSNAVVAIKTPQDDEETEAEPTTKKSSKKLEDQGLFMRIATNPYFENTTMGVIVFNALWMGADTEWNHESLKVDGKLPLDPAATVIENFFCIYFTIELTIRFLAFPEKRMCLFDAWFVFDGILVCCMILETWIMVIVKAIIGGGGEGVGPLGALRLLRLLRLARMGRLMRFVPELGKLVKGMIKAFRSVFFILIFLILVMYVFAIIFTGTLSDREKYPLTPACESLSEAEIEEEVACIADFEYSDDGGPYGRDLFATMGDSFMTLFTRGVLGDNLDETVQAILDESVWLMWAFFIFFAITFATLLNMLIGVICEVIQDAAEEEERQDNESLLKTTIEEAFDEIDLNDDGVVSPKEWAQVKKNEKVRQTLKTLGLEEERMEERLEQMSNFIFREKDDHSEDGGQGLTVEELTRRVVEMRPDADASALDLELMKSQVVKDQKLFKTKLRKMQCMLNKHLNGTNPKRNNSKSLSGRFSFASSLASS